MRTWRDAIYDRVTEALAMRFTSALGINVTVTARQETFCFFFFLPKKLIQRFSRGSCYVLINVL